MTSDTPHNTDTQLDSSTSQPTCRTQQNERCEDSHIPQQPHSPATSTALNHECTEPAIKCSKMQKSTNSLSDGSYDMFDDVSDLSSDEHDTVSIASTDHTHGEDHPHSDDHTHGDELDNDGEESPYDQISGILDDMQSLPVLRFEDDSPPKYFEHLSEEATPQQSIVTVKHEPQTKQIEHENPRETSKKGDSTPWSLKALQVSLTFLFIFLLGAIPSLIGEGPRDGQAQLDWRRARLNTTMALMGASPQSFNISHLLPEPHLVGKSLFGYDRYGNTEIRYQGVSPNLLVFSLPSPEGDGHYSEPGRTISVTRSNEAVGVDIVHPMEGVRIITLPLHNAYGLVTVQFWCCGLDQPVTITHDFGNPILHAVRNLVDRVAATDLQPFFDDATNTAHKIEERTKEFTTVLQKEVVRDLNVSRLRALSIFSNLKALAARKRTSFMA